MGDMERWRNRVALVTGASSGIGQAVVRELASSGMRVVGCARRAERLRSLQESLERQAADLLAVPTDLRDEMEITQLFEAVRERWGGVDVLVNSAGVNRKSFLVDGDSADWREMWQVNVLALSTAIRKFIPGLRISL